MENEYELYFYFDGDHDSDDEDAVIVPMCVACHDGQWGYLGWYYKGNLSPWKYTCGKCQAVVKDGVEGGQFETIAE